MDYFIFLLGCAIIGFWLGVWATYANFTKPLETHIEETETKLRRELGEVRRELLEDERLLALAGRQIFGTKHSVAHFHLSSIAEPKIEQRSPSDVFFIDNFEDLL